MVLEARIASLEETLARAIVLDAEDAAPGVAVIGSSVLIEDLASGALSQYRLASAHRPDQPTVVRVLVEHVDLRRRAQDLAGSSEPDPAELHELGERLENHIRHQERVLFPMIEEALPMKELEQVAAAVECVDARRE